MGWIFVRKNVITCEVLVCGYDLFALCVSILLKEAGTDTVLFVTDAPCPTHPFLLPSMTDPPTRAHVAHGYDVAQYLSGFCSSGIEFLNSQCWAKNFVRSVDSFWVATEGFQSEELNIAHRSGFGVTPTTDMNFFTELHKGAFITDVKSLWESGIRYYKSLGGKVFSGTLISMHESSNGVDTTCQLDSPLSQWRLESEVIILGIGYKIADFLPEYNSIAIPMLDSYFIYNRSFDPSEVKTLYKSAVGHWWTGKAHQSLWVSGPRFGLPFAGAGLKELPKSSAALNNQLNFHKKTLFPLLKMENALLSDHFYAVSCWPCDELPVLGELGRWGRVIGTFGWLSVENSSGPWCARIVSEMVLKGKSEHYHSRLSKQRLMTF